MTIQQLNYAIAVFRAGSINRAAQKLYIAQPNLSNAIKSLEDELNITLFQRTPRGMEPTRAGEKFILRAMELVAQFDAFETLYASRQADVLSLSITTARSSEFSNCIAAFCNRFTERQVPYRIRLREATNSEVIADIAEGDADLGIICPSSTTSDYYYQSARSRGLEILPLHPKKYCLLFSADHPLADAPHITVPMLEPYAEVVHADFDMPLYPTSDYRFENDLQEINGKKRVIFIYERGTLMEVLANVTGSYMWSTTTNARLKAAYGLVERDCEAPPIRGMDAIMYNRAVSLSEDVRQLIETIKAYDALLRQEE